MLQVVQERWSEVGVWGDFQRKLEKDSERELASLSLSPTTPCFHPIICSTWSGLPAKLHPCVGKSGGEFADLTSSATIAYDSRYTAHCFFRGDRMFYRQQLHSIEYENPCPIPCFLSHARHRPITSPPSSPPPRYRLVLP